MQQMVNHLLVYDTVIGIETGKLNRITFQITN